MSLSTEIQLTISSLTAELKKLKTDQTQEIALLVQFFWNNLINQLLNEKVSAYVDEETDETYALGFKSEEPLGLSDKDVSGGDLLELIGITVNGVTFLFDSMRPNNINLILDENFIFRFINALKEGLIIPFEDEKDETSKTT